MNTQVIITKKAGQDIPRGYLQVALKNCPTYHGLALRDPNNGEPIIEVSHNHKTADLDELVKTLAQLKDCDLMLILGKMTQDFDPEADMQPFVFQQRNEEFADGVENVLAIAFEGDFPNYSKPGGKHTDEYNLWDNFIYPTLDEKFQAASDLPAFYAKLRSSQFEQAVMNTASHRAVAVFLPLEGDIIPFGRNELGGEFDWGATSNTFDWGKPTVLEKAAETAIAAVKKGGSRLSRLTGSTSVSTNVTPAAPAPEKKEEPAIVTDDNGIHHKTGSDDIWAKWPGTSSKTHTMKAVPASLQGNAKNAWIRLFTNNPTGELPKGKDAKGFMVPVLNELIGFAQDNVSTKDDVKRLQSRIHHFQSGAKPGEVSAGMAAANAQPVTEQPQEVKNPENPVPEDKRPPADFLPELSANDKLGAISLITEWLTNPKAPTALEIQRLVAKYKPYSLTSGFKFEDYGKFGIADVKLLGKKHSDALALAFIELQRRLYELGEFEPKVTTEHINDKDARVPAKPAQQVEVPPAQPAAAAPKKTSRLSRLTAA